MKKNYNDHGNTTSFANQQITSGYIPNNAVQIRNNNHCHQWPRWPYSMRPNHNNETYRQQKINVNSAVRIADRRRYTLTHAPIEIL